MNFDCEDNYHDELNELQREGINKYGLTEKQVQSKNFGSHTIEALVILKKKKENHSKSYGELFSSIEGYDEAQVIGFSKYDLTNDQIESSNYGIHTLYGMRDIMRLAITCTWKNAFAMLDGLNRDQIENLLDFQLTEKDVLENKNFGGHTIDAMKILLGKGNAKTSNKAFSMVKGLDEAQSIGISVFDYNREQVENPKFMTSERKTYLLNSKAFTLPQNKSKNSFTNENSEVKENSLKKSTNRRPSI